MNNRKYIETLAKHIKPPHVNLIAYKGESIHVGHLIEFHTHTYVRHVIVWDLTEHPDVLIVIITFHEIEMASDEDIILPRNLIGHPFAADFQYPVMMPIHSLSKIIGTIPPHIMLDLKKGKGLKGLPYIDSKDLRWTFHEQLGEDLLEPQLQALNLLLKRVE